MNDQPPACDCGQTDWHLHGDGIHDEAAAVTRWISLGLKLPPGEFLVSGSIPMPQCTCSCNGCCYVQRAPEHCGVGVCYG